MIKFVYQDKPKGTGDAVLKTKKYIKDKYFLMLLPDDLIIKKNCSKSMISSHKKYKASVMASMSVNKKTVSRWGIYKLNKKLNKTDYLISGVIEKPSDERLKFIIEESNKILVKAQARLEALEYIPSGLQ